MLIHGASRAVGVGELHRHTGFSAQRAWGVRGHPDVHGRSSAPSRYGVDLGQQTRLMSACTTCVREPDICTRQVNAKL